MLTIVTAAMLNHTAATRADEVFGACGAKASGVILVNGKKACIGKGSDGGQVDYQKMKELSSKTANLTLDECGPPPNYSDYGLSHYNDTSDKLAKMLLTRDEQRRFDCINETMKYKYPKESKNMKAEFEAIWRRD